MEAAAAAAKSLQSCPTLCNPIDGSPPGSPVPGILQARTLEWVPISFSNAWKWKVKVKSLSRLWLLANYFKILWGFLPYIDMNLATGARVSPSWTPFHLPPHPIHLGCSRAPALSALLRSSNLDWSSVLHGNIHASVLFSQIWVSFAVLHIRSSLPSF